jgi:hypothetical protein
LDSKDEKSLKISFILIAVIWTGSDLPMDSIFFDTSETPAIRTWMEEDAESNAQEEHLRAEEEPPRLEVRGPLSVRLRLLSKSLRRGITAVVSHMFTP